MRCAVIFRRRSRRDGATGKTNVPSSRRFTRTGDGARRLRQELTPTARGTDRTQLCALLRDRRYATLSSAGAGEHSETAVGTRGSVQLEPDSAKTAGSGYAARTEKPRWTGVFATFALSAKPDDGRFANLAVYSPGWPPDSTHFSLPHIPSSLAHSESFRHGLLATTGRNTPHKEPGPSSGRCDRPPRPRRLRRR